MPLVVYQACARDLFTSSCSCQSVMVPTVDTGISCTICCDIRQPTTTKSVPDVACGPSLLKRYRSPIRSDTTYPLIQREASANRQSVIVLEKVRNPVRGRLYPLRLIHSISTYPMYPFQAQETPLLPLSSGSLDEVLITTRLLPQKLLLGTVFLIGHSKLHFVEKFVHLRARC